MKKIVLIGGSGFIGNNLKPILKDYHILEIKGREVLSMDSGKLATLFVDAEIIINLAGQSVMGYWTKAYKRKLFESRVNLTQMIEKAIGLMQLKPKMFISASAIGIYADGKPVTEESHYYADNYLAELIISWEKSVMEIEKHGLLVSILRFGIVLGKNGGAYPVLKKLINLNLGAVFGKGNQSYSFIYIVDAVRAIRFIIDNRISGIVNMVSPNYTTNKELMLSLKKYFSSWLLWYIPDWILKGVLAESSVIFLEGQQVIPGVLCRHKFIFEVESIDNCIDKIERS